MRSVPRGSPVSPWRREERPAASSPRSRRGTTAPSAPRTRNAERAACVRAWSPRARTRAAASLRARGLHSPRRRAAAREFRARAPWCGAWARGRWRSAAVEGQALARPAAVGDLHLARGLLAALHGRAALAARLLALPGL